MFQFCIKKFMYKAKTITHEIYLQKHIMYLLKNSYEKFIASNFPLLLPLFTVNYKISLTKEWVKKYWKNSHMKQLCMSSHAISQSSLSFYSYSLMLKLSLLWNFKENFKNSHSYENSKLIINYQINLGIMCKVTT